MKDITPEPEIAEAKVATLFASSASAFSFETKYFNSDILLIEGSPLNVTSYNTQKQPSIASSTRAIINQSMNYTILTR